MHFFCKKKSCILLQICSRMPPFPGRRVRTFNSTLERPNKMIKAEHKALAAALVDKLQNMELPHVKDHYVATRDAVSVLSSAMYRQYHVDALPAIADLFNELFDATGNVCGSVSAHFYNDERDEDGEVLGNAEVGTWEAATYATIATCEVNCNYSRGWVWAETFAADVAEKIELCISGWEYADCDTDHDLEYQDFQYRK